MYNQVLRGKKERWTQNQAKNKLRGGQTAIALHSPKASKPEISSLWEEGEDTTPPQRDDATTAFRRRNGVSALLERVERFNRRSPPV